jgi:protein required for attachment to host cells
MLKSKPSSLYRVDEDEVAVGSGGGGTAPTEAQMKLFIAQTLSMNFAYNAPVVVLKFDVAENGNITGLFKDAARPRMFSFTLDGESVTYKPYKPGKMDSLESDEDVQEWEAFSEGYGFRVDAGVGGKKKPQCVKPTAYNCGSACINIMKSCKIKTNDPTVKDRIKKLNEIGKDYAKTTKSTKPQKGVKSDEPQIKPKVESKKPSSQKSSTQKTVEPEVKTKPNVEPKKTESKPKSKANPFYSDEPIKDYETFKKEIPKELARINFENNYDSLIPINKVREELKGRVSDKDFDKWMADSQLDNDNIRLQGGDPNKPLPGGIKLGGIAGTREYVGFNDEDAIKKAEVEIKRKPGQIVDVKEFESLADEVYDKLNKENNYDDLVPIYQIRRAMGDKVSRGDFNNLMMKIQSNDSYQLMEGSVEDSAPDKIQDSITIGLGRLRAYAKKLK